MSLREVSEAEFFKAVGRRICHPFNEGRYPGATVFRLPAGAEVGRIERTILDAKSLPVLRYLLPVNEPSGV